MKAYFYKLLSIAAMLLTLTLFFACDVDPESNKLKNETVNAESYMHRDFDGDSILLKNPYSVENMSKALDVLKAEYDYSFFPELADFHIPTTHLYIKFNPKSEEEEALLKKDSTLHLFDYRLDCEYKEEYLEKRLPNRDSISDYYTAVTKDRDLPEVRHEVISELYIPEQDTYFSDAVDNDKYLITKTITNKTDFLNLLIYEAFRLTQNEDELLDESSTETNRWIFGSRWQPSGLINIRDNVEKTGANMIPLEGAQVLVRQWFTISNGITNSVGYFQTGHVRGKVRYVLQWERHDYSIRSGGSGQAELLGPHLKKQPWYLSIIGGHGEFRGHIHRAAYHYYYKDILGLRRPPQNTTWQPQMKIGSYYEYNGSINGNHSEERRFLGILPRIKIYNPWNYSDEIYGTTIHELAHASHWHMRKQYFNDTEQNVKESWARGVQIELTKSDYPLYVAPSFLPNYTLVVRDLIDGPGDYYDTVSGYTLRQLEDALYEKQNWYNWRDNIIFLHNNATENNVPALFDYWY